MSRITTLLSVATHRIGVASIHPRTPAAPAISIPHPSAGPLLVAVLLGIGVLVLISRVNSVLVNLVSQLVQAAAIVGRMLALTLVLVVIGTLILLHI
jgi:hypothetical protein